MEKEIHFGIIDLETSMGAMDCWECRKNTRDLAWYDSDGFNLVCQDCIAKIFAEVGLDWETLRPGGF